MPDLCDLRVQRVRKGFRKKPILGKKHSFNPPPEMLICYGTPEQLRRFIYDQRGEKPGAPMADLRRYLIERVGHSPDWAKEYTVLREWSVDHEDPAGSEAPAGDEPNASTTHQRPRSGSRWSRSTYQRCISRLQPRPENGDEPVSTRGTHPGRETDPGVPGEPRSSWRTAPPGAPTHGYRHRDPRPLGSRAARRSRTAGRARTPALGGAGVHALAPPPDEHPGDQAGPGTDVAVERPSPGGRDVRLAEASTVPDDRRHGPRAAGHWRATVRPDDLIICLGDVAVASFWTDPEHVNDVRSCPGRRLLITGNHDVRQRKQLQAAGFTDQYWAVTPRHRSPGGRHAPSAPSAARASGQHPRAPARRGRRHRATRKRDRRTHRLQADPARRSAGTGEKTTTDRQMTNRRTARPSTPARPGIDPERPKRRPVPRKQSAGGDQPTDPAAAGMNEARQCLIALGTTAKPSQPCGGQRRSEG